MTFEQTPTDCPAAPLVIITGLSGAGKSTAMRVFEDLGRYCLDNLPPGIIASVYNLHQRSEQGGSGVVIASDVRSGALFDDLVDTVGALENDGIDVEVLYLDCSTDVLINRFSEVRRTHPLQTGRSLRESIDEERRRLEQVRAIARNVMDTTTFGTGELRRELLTRFGGGGAEDVVRLKFVSFGFKYGVPRDADYVFDVRFLPNPFYVPELRAMTGEDDEVYEYVMSNEGADLFFEGVVELLGRTLDPFVQVGKLQINVAVGCTGGKHRSVAFARRFAEAFFERGVKASAIHRDAAKLEG